MNSLKRFSLASGAFLYTFLSLQVALADDTEIYVTRDLPADQRVRPNILFIIDSSGSMTTSVAGTGKNRNQVVIDVTKSLIDELKVSEDVNIGIMRFSGNHGGRVLQEVKQLTNANAADMKTIVGSIPANGNTPLLETYYESYLYLAGKSAYWGGDSNSTVDTTCTSGWFGTTCTDHKATSSVATSMNNAYVYKSPIQHSCQKTNIIYLSDGEPTQDVKSNSTVKALVTANTMYPASTCGTGNGACLPHLAEYMANQDLAPDVAGTQNVTTHTIGFAIDLPLLANTATAGGGRYFTTSNTSGLTDALKSIVVDILAENTSFTSPSVAVSAYNNLGYRNDLYYALFRPAEGARWLGNVKRYKLIRDNSGDNVIVDSQNNPAIDPATGFFRETSRSYWSSTNDGRDVGTGGAAENIPTTRKALTWIKPSTGTDRTLPATNGITDSVASISIESADVTQAKLGAVSAAERTKFINWGLGKDPDNTSTYRKQLGDVLHGEPRLVAYTTDEDLARASSATSSEQLYMFFGTNEGFIHAVDTKTGVEKFAFIPEELLPNFGSYYKNAKGSVNKKYGMDGQINLWVEYGALNATAKTRTISKANLYAGMRRGGRNYYALDVLDINAPKVKWVIKGGTSGFESLGQTWSTPQLSSIKVAGTTTKVLVFTGGYDTNQDNDSPNTPRDDTVGNSLFIVNADTGKLLWSAGKTGATLNLATMTNSIPADPTLIDVNGDGLLDTLFAADTRGQLFRFDFDHTGASTTATGGRVAALGGTTATDNRRFFSAPDVALHRQRGGKPVYTIALGSGYRAHPLNDDTVDRFYVVRDANVYSKPANYNTTLTESDLVDVSSVNLTEAEAAAILEDIREVEVNIAAFNTAVNDAQAAFNAHKDTSQYSAKARALGLANAQANDLQRRIDQVSEENPYLDFRAPEVAEQHAFQAHITNLQTALKAQVDGGYPVEYSARLNNAYNALLRDQADLDTQYQSLLALQQAVINADEASLPGLEANLAAANTAYAGAVTQRDLLNGQLQALITAVQSAPAGDPLDPADPLTAAINALMAETGSHTLYSDTELLARSEASKQAALEQEADNLADNQALLATDEAQRLVHVGEASALLAELEALAAAPYAGSPTLTPEQLAAAQALYGADLTIHEAYQYLIDQAILAANTALPGLRSDINELYAQLSPGDAYQPNLELLNQSSGWFMRLPKGEKVLSGATSFRGAVLFTTFSPRGETTSTCGPDVGKGRLYALSLLDASAVFVTTIDGVDTPVRSFALQHSGIPPTPSVILSDSTSGNVGTAPALLIGTESLNPKCGPGTGFCENTPTTPTYWREN